MCSALTNILCLNELSVHSQQHTLLRDMLRFSTVVRRQPPGGNLRKQLIHLYSVHKSTLTHKKITDRCPKDQGHAVQSSSLLTLNCAPCNETPIVGLWQLVQNNVTLE